MFKHIIQTGTMLFVAVILVCTSLSALPVCCSTPAGVCIPAVGGMRTRHTGGALNGASPACRHSSKPRLDPCSQALSMDSGTETCCRTRRCDRYGPAAYFNFSFPQGFYPIQKTIGISHVSAQAQKTIATDSLSASPKAVAIYLLTQSFIC